VVAANIADFRFKFAIEGFRDSIGGLMGKNCRYFFFVEHVARFFYKSLIFSLSFCFLLGLAFTSGAIAQEQYPKPKAFIAPDSDLIGSPIQFTLFVQHPARAVVLFPDSGYNFEPFEYRTKKVFPSRLVNGFDKDSVVADCCQYELASFNLDPVLSLQLPIFYITPEGDSFPVNSNEARLYQKFMSRDRDSAYADTLLSSTQPLQVQERINYPYIGLAIVVVLAVVLLANVFLGRPIERWLKMAVLGRRHKFFVRAFDRLVEQINASKDPTLIERALNLWKTYIERLDDVPYSTFTTSDFSKNMPDSSLMKSLHTIDRWIYGGFKPESVENVFGTLKRLSIRMYSRKREEVRNG
jgi:hypothetical protein